MPFEMIVRVSVWFIDVVEELRQRVLAAVQQVLAHPSKTTIVSFTL